MVINIMIMKLFLVQAEWISWNKRTPFQTTQVLKKMELSYSVKDSMHICFTNRVINNWNSLPSNSVLAGTLNSFKNLDKHWKQF